MLETLNVHVLESMPISPRICFKAGEKKNEVREPEERKTHQPARPSHPATCYTCCATASQQHQTGDGENPSGRPLPQAGLKTGAAEVPA